MQEENLPSQRQFQIVHGGKEEKISKEKGPTLPADHFNTQIKEFVASIAVRRGNITITEPFELKKGRNSLTFQIPVSTRKGPITARWILEFTLYTNHLSIYPITATNPEIKAGLVDKALLQGRFPKKSLEGLYEDLKQELEKEQGQKVVKIVITDEGEFKPIYESLVSSLMELVRDEDHEVVREVVNGHKEKKSKAEMEVQAERTRSEELDRAKENRKNELLNIPRVVELRGIYEGMQTSTIERKRKEAKRNFDMLNDPDKIEEYFKGLTVHDDKDTEALVQAELINQKYAPILKENKE